MRGIKTVYRFGNLYDEATRKRILIEDGAKVIVLIDPEYLMEQDPYLEGEPLLNAVEKKEEMNTWAEKNGHPSYWKLFEAGKKLYFDISAGIKRKGHTVHIKCKFQLRLQEDLYIYNQTSKPKLARFWKCQSLVEACLTNFEFFEPIQAKSLNDAYTKTYELYFAMFGSPGANAFDRMYEQTPDDPIRGKTEEIQKQPADNTNTIIL